MEFGTILKKLRREAEMTQGRLAELLAVSPQAVSRWENNTALPDITLLPPIANLFGVTTDVLLGVDVKDNRRRICMIITEANEIMCNNPEGEYDKALGLLRDGLRLYPDDWELKMTLARFLLWYGEKEGYPEVNGICEEIIDRCPELEKRFEAIGMICSAARETDNRKRAMELANTMPSMTGCREEQKLRLLDGEELDKTCRDYLHLLEICMTELFRQMAKGKSSAEVAEFYRKTTALGELVYDGDDFIKSEYFWPGQSTFARLFADAGDNDRAVDCLRRELALIRRNLNVRIERVSPLLPDYIQRECTEYPMEWMREMMRGKVGGAITYIEEEFPESFRLDGRCGEILAEYREVMEEVMMAK